MLLVAEVIVEDLKKVVQVEISEDSISLDSSLIAPETLQVAEIGLRQLVVNQWGNQLKIQKDLVVLQKVDERYEWLNLKVKEQHRGQEEGNEKSRELVPGHDNNVWRLEHDSQI